ncbi:MAG: undecaprenyldiphospho-muramoylpentapeptide beta-N-acetylglucosaminyltransferase [Firmicutes bacterium]|nr:undecaprenyldiphospho-muramoylpentapeptide beta-N-acetylglucosaminyltransferase [Bacillota bacterium]
MKIIFAGGGTAGHINPAISISNYIKERDDNFEALFIGTERGLEKKLVPKAGYNIKYVDVCGLDRKNLLKNVSVLMKLQKAKRDCIKILKDFAPDAVVCTGGYVSGPVMMAAHKLGIPSLIHEQNVYPGFTVKGSQEFASFVAISFDETKEHLKCKGKCVVTGNPIREELLHTDKAEARKKLGLSDKPFVLVFGGSLGAAKINETMLGLLKMTDGHDMDILFGTGDRNYENILKRIKDEGIKLPEGTKVVPYINNMNEVLAACDIVVSRAGAITVSEIAAAKKPSVLIPSPNVVRNHQEQNAREFEKNGAAKVITENCLTSEILYDTIKKMLDDSKNLQKMSENAGKLAKRDALAKIYSLVLEMVR